ncbi:MAG TPA: dihydrofolate reductase family protein, partial [Spirochaetia bacterium]|nr:dihydrofolate reductase family protein [Spirochaetia bacterium]
MAKVVVFNMVTLDGYFCDPNGDMSWAHAHDDEWLTFVEGNAKGDAVLLFGRVTYQMMASYWPTPLAAKNDPLVAERMNSYQ